MHTALSHHLISFLTLIGSFVYSRASLFTFDRCVGPALRIRYNRRARNEQKRRFVRHANYPVTLFGDRLFEQSPDGIRRHRGGVPHCASSSN
ncbi:hypothetical protein BU23DRAFT_289636 [Bimuria novae-zelandiae CBS 107.79]|uniref:DUF1748-domain-containing protein n=1 Tax=Bimuria novae-zelandiae CBS 107.79 TaxID=1447943 RepID=A0A6A5UQR8_9PLEO|nr:hypothetical protein BU23DRAFT_289636 [Bimuria novae-zelandiae CBS 107.79]